MKSVIFALVAFATISASAQDTTGCKISANGKYATCKVLGGEAGDQVQYVTFKIRAPSAPIAPGTGCYAGEGNHEVACPVGNIPQWLKDLNQAFLDAGFTAPTHPEDELSPGGN